jgi:hypothetical protein
MASEKAWYWLAAGVLALGLNGAYQDGQFGWVHELAGRTTEIVEVASMRGLAFVTAAEVMLGRNPEAIGEMEASLGRMQGKLACERIEMAKRRIDMARMQKDLATARVDRQLARVQMKMDKIRVIAIEGANRTQRCSDLSRMVVRVPRVEISNLPDVQIPEIPEIQLPSHSSHDPI